MTAVSDLTRFRDHCRAMSEAEHKPECQSLMTAEWRWPPNADMLANPVWWKPPHCDGCNSEKDRALFARLADEVDEYESLQGALFEVET